MKTSKLNIKLIAHNHLYKRYNKQYLSVTNAIKQITYDVDNTDDIILKAIIVAASASRLVKLESRADALKAKIDALTTFRRA
jgi:hypothetical protein